MIDNEKISVVIPTYNRAKTINKSIKSVLNQTYTNIEVIVVDDCSTDNTETIIKKIKDKRVKYYKLDCNKGACFARNYGIKKATGNYIAFQDSDDIFEKNKLEKQYENIKKNKSDLNFCRIKLHANNFILFVPTEEQLANILKGNYKEEIIKRNYISTQAILVKKSVIEKNLFDDSLPRFQDYDLVLRLIPNFKISFTNDALVNLYRQDNSISNSYEKMEIAVKIMINKKYPYSEKKE